MRIFVLAPVALAVFFSGCATQTPPAKTVESPQSIAAQRQAQASALNAAPSAPTLKRKIALGRISNETNYGRSLLRETRDDSLRKQVADLLSKALTESGKFIVLERPDIEQIKEESKLTGQTTNIVGADALIIGSLTEFGRKIIGETGFLSSTKRQIAFAKVDVRLVDTNTSQVFFSAAGAGESSTESASVAGFGSQASYDGTLNDSAIRQAVSEVVNRLSAELMNRPWRTYILSIDGQRAFISGGKSQGIKPGMAFLVQTTGEKIKSPQTGFDITLPGKTIAEVRVDSNFGDNESNEGSVVSVISGSLAGKRAQDLIVIEKDQK